MVVVGRLAGPNVNNTSKGRLAYYKFWSGTFSTYLLSTSGLLLDRKRDNEILSSEK